MSVFMFLLSTETKAQLVKGEGFIGLNLSQIDGDQVYGYKNIGIHGGIGAMVPVYQKNNFNIDIALEVVFNNRGSHQRATYSDTINGQIYNGAYDVSMNYLEVPLMVYFTDKQITSFGIGASYGNTEEKLMST